MELRNNGFRRSDFYNLCLEKDDNFGIQDGPFFKQLIDELRRREDEEILYLTKLDFQTTEEEIKTNKIQKSETIQHFRDYAYYLRNIAKEINKLISFNNQDFHLMPSQANIPQIFLSYAYEDRAISLGLYHFFASRGISLFVDWMHNSKLETGQKIVDALIPPIHNSRQLLLLLTPNTEFSTSSSSFIRSWCSWEIGVFSDNNPHGINEAYYLTYEDTPVVFARPGPLFAMKALKDVRNQRCY